MNKNILTKTEILDAAEVALRKYGPDKTSVTDVAKLLKVSHGTLYRHYESKAALKEAVTERWLDQKIIAPLTEISAGAQQDIPGQMKQYIGKLIELKRGFYQTDPEMFEMYAEVTAASAELIREHIMVIRGHLSALITLGMERGQIRKGDADSMAEAIFHATSRFHHPSHAYEWNEAAIEEQFDQVWRLISFGIFQ